MSLKESVFKGHLPPRGRHKEAISVTELSLWDLSRQQTSVWHHKIAKDPGQETEHAVCWDKSEKNTEAGCRIAAKAIFPWKGLRCEAYKSLRLIKNTGRDSDVRQSSICMCHCSLMLRFILLAASLLAFQGETRPAMHLIGCMMFSACLVL